MSSFMREFRLRNEIILAWKKAMASLQLVYRCVPIAKAEASGYSNIIPLKIFRVVESESVFTEENEKENSSKYPIIPASPLLSYCIYSCIRWVINL